MTSASFELAIATATLLCIASVLEAYFIFYLFRHSSRDWSVRTIQWGCHGFSLLMLLTRLAQLLCMISGMPCPYPVLLLFLLAQYSYYLFASIYYLELLKLTEVLHKSRWLKRSQIVRYQKAAVAFNAVCNFAGLFQYTYFVKFSDPSWLAKVSMLSALAFTETPMLGAIVSWTIYKAIRSQITKAEKWTGATPPMHQPRHFEVSKAMIFGLVMLQASAFTTYSIGGALVGNPDPAVSSYCLPLTGLSTALAGIEICLFTMVFSTLTRAFIDYTLKNSSNLVSRQIESKRSG
ncbi:hypothetical protein HDV03_000467 [Kappamyces sp. JEL0829]|nr:hypothetical protein HDV03_000467 [Kappamyces sp. JEL0829]